MNMRRRYVCLLVWSLLPLAGVSTIATWQRLRSTTAQLRSRAALQASLLPDLERLAAYRTAERELLHDWQQAPAQAAPAPGALLPAAIPAPDASDVTRAPPLSGWVGVQTDLRWDRISASNALVVVSAFTAAQPPWRVERLAIEALPGSGDQVTLQVRFALAEPAAEGAQPRRLQ